MGLSRIAYLELAVPDISKSVRYAEQILGLWVVEKTANSVYLTCNDRHHELILTKGPERHQRNSYRGSTSCRPRRVRREGD